MYITKFYSDILFGSFVQRNTSFAKMGQRAQTYMYIAKFYSDILFGSFVQRNNRFFEIWEVTDCLEQLQYPKAERVYSVEKHKYYWTFLVIFHQEDTC